MQNPPLTLFCPFCTSYCTLQDSLKEHLYTAHLEELTAPLPQLIQLAPNDDSANTLIDSSYLSQCLKYPCSFCSACFYNLDLISKHIADVHGTSCPQNVQTLSKIIVDNQSVAPCGIQSRLIADVHKPPNTSGTSNDAGSSQTPCPLPALPNTLNTTTPDPLPSLNASQRLDDNGQLSAVGIQRDIRMQYGLNGRPVMRWDPITGIDEVIGYEQRIEEPARTAQTTEPEEPAEPVQTAAPAQTTELVESSETEDDSDEENMDPQCFKCTFCSMAWVDNRDLVAHLKQCHRNRKLRLTPYGCKICNKKFHRNQQLIRHVRVRHENGKSWKKYTDRPN